MTLIFIFFSFTCYKYSKPVLLCLFLPYIFPDLNTIENTHDKVAWKTTERHPTNTSEQIECHRRLEPCRQAGAFNIDEMQTNCKVQGMASNTVIRHRHWKHCFQGQYATLNACEGKMATISCQLIVPCAFNLDPT